MKNFFCPVLLVLILPFVYSRGFSQSHKLDSVKVEFQGFDTETDMDVSCDAFNYTFLKTKRIKVIRQKPDLLEFESLKKNFVSAKDRSFDVRGKITYFYGAKAVKYCFDTFGYFYKDGKSYHNKQLLIAVANNVYTNHPKYLDTLKYHE